MTLTIILEGWDTENGICEVAFLIVDITDLYKFTSIAFLKKAFCLYEQS